MSAKVEVFLAYCNGPGELGKTKINSVICILHSYASCRAKVTLDNQRYFLTITIEPAWAYSPSQRFYLKEPIRFHDWAAWNNCLCSTSQKQELCNLSGVFLKKRVIIKGKRERFCSLYWHKWVIFSFHKREKSCITLVL